MYKNIRKLYSKLLSIYFHNYNNTTNKEKEKMGEIYSPNNLLNEGFKFIYPKKKDEEKSKSRLEKTIAERIKLRKQKSDDKDLTNTLLLEGDSDEFTDIPDLPPLEGDKEEGKEEKD